MVEHEPVRLKKIGVTEAVYFSNWAVPMLIVNTSNGSFLLCVDYSAGLNKSLEFHKYPLSLPEDLFVKLNKDILRNRIYQTPIDKFQ